MTASHASAPHATHYYVPQPSLYPIFLSGGMFLLALGFILLMNKFAPGPWVMSAGAAVIIFVLFKWFGAVIAENQRGDYTDWEDKSFRQGMVWFIGSEVMFFAAFFAALFYCRTISVPALAGMDPLFTLYQGYTGGWPTAGPKGASFTPMGAWGIPSINTALLLTSGVTLTWAHWGLMKAKRSQLNLGLILTVLLGIGLVVRREASWRWPAYAGMEGPLGGGFGTSFPALQPAGAAIAIAETLVVAAVVVACIREVWVLTGGRTPSALEGAAGRPGAAQRGDGVFG